MLRPVSVNGPYRSMTDTGQKPSCAGPYRSMARIGLFALISLWPLLGVDDARETHAGWH